MSFRKNNLSFVIWILYLVILGLIFVMGIKYWGSINVLSYGIGIGGALLLLLLVGMVYLYSEKKLVTDPDISKEMTAVLRKTERVIMPAALVGIMASRGIVVGIRMQNASVEQGCLEILTSSASVLCLFLFWLVVRGIAGRLSAGLFLVLAGFLPYGLKMTENPAMVNIYLALLGMVLFFTRKFLTECRLRQNGKKKLLFAVLVGVCTGILMAFDPSAGVLLLVASGCMNLSDYGEQTLVNQKPFFVVVGSAALGYLTGGFAIEYFSEMKLFECFFQTLEKESQGFDFSFLAQNGEVSFWILLCFTFWGVFGFLKRREEEIFSVWMAGFVYAVLVCAGRLGNYETLGKEVLFLVMAVLAAISLGEQFYIPYVPDVETVTEQKEPVQKEPEQVPRVKTGRYIKNPLPLPPKHVRKVMDFPLEIREDQMKFDIEVSDNDDFDLQN